MTKIGLDSPKGFVVNSLKNALKFQNLYLFQSSLDRHLHLVVLVEVLQKIEANL